MRFYVYGASRVSVYVLFSKTTKSFIRSQCCVYTSTGRYLTTALELANILMRIDSIQILNLDRGKYGLRSIEADMITAL